MAIVKIRRSPDWKNYDAHMDASGGRDHTPEGLILHAAGEVDGMFQVIDIWESAEVADKYEREVALPAAMKVTGENAELPEATIYELYEIIRG